MLRLRQLLALATLTALEAIRQPICLLLTTACVLLTALTPVLLMHKFGEDGKLVRDSGLALHFVFGLFIAAYAACASLARERQSGTAAAVLSKPVSRDTFFFAKFIGIAVVIAAFSACATLATLLSERVAEKLQYGETLVGYVTDWRTAGLLIGVPFLAFLLAGAVNYRRHRPFGSTAFALMLIALCVVLVAVGFFDRTGHLGPYDMRVQWHIVPVSVLITLALVALSAIALTLATRLNTVPTLTACMVVFLLGLMSDYLLGRNAPSSALAWVLYRLTPNWQHFWVADALDAGGVVPLVYVCRAGLYAAAYTGGVLCLGAFLFRRMELR